MPKAPSRYNPYKNKKIAKFRRDLVLKNLLENKYINEKKFNEIKNKKIVLKKNKKIFLEDSRYYVEEVRKDIIDKLGYDKVYKEGLNIKTPLNLNLQQLDDFTNGEYSIIAGTLSKNRTEKNFS